MGKFKKPAKPCATKGCKNLVFTEHNYCGPCRIKRRTAWRKKRFGAA